MNNASQTDQRVTVHNDYFIAFGKPINENAEPYAAKWEIYEVVGVEPCDVGGDRIIPGDLFASGDVKWDGCSNWFFTADNCMHQCSRLGLEAISDILAKCWDATSSIIPKSWDNNLAMNGATSASLVR